MRWTLVLALVLAGTIRLDVFASSPYGSGPYMVFFNSGSADISALGANTIRLFVRDRLRDGDLADTDMVVLHAHTDSAEASEALSQLRGERVRMRLAELGVPFDRILVFAHGDRRPLVLRPPHPSEVQNRFVELSVLSPTPRR